MYVENGDRLCFYHQCLNLFLGCTDSTPAREMLNILPPLLIHIHSSPPFSPKDPKDSLTAALKHNDRVTQISLNLNLTGSLPPELEKPFPVLTDLQLTPQTTARRAATRGWHNDQQSQDDMTSSAMITAR